MIEPAMRSGQQDLACRLKLALAGGPAAARLILDADAGAPLDEADRLLQQRLKLHMKFEQAIAMPLTPRNALAFLKMHGDLLLATRRLELQERRLEQRCVESLRRHEIALERLRQAQPTNAGQTACGPSGQAAAADSSPDDAGPSLPAVSAA